jgi:CHAT domain-containing protein/tetratricopeptide (TPR) repeat protein
VAALLTLSNRLPAQLSSPEKAQQLLRDANAKIAAGQLLEAERIYRSTLETDDVYIRRRCLDALIMLNTTLGRHDQAIQVALRYQPLLRAANDEVRLRELALQLGESYLALGHYRQGEQMLEGALDTKAATPLPATAAIAALASLARSAETRGDLQRASRFWQRVEEAALAQLVGRPEPPLGEQVQYALKLAEAYGYLKKPDQAIERLTALLPLHDRLKDPAGMRSTLRALARHYNDRKQPEEAEHCLRRALDLQDKLPEADNLGQADLWSDLADTLSRQGRRSAAEGCKNRAAEFYDAALRDRRPEPRLLTRTATAFWKLQRLQQQREQFVRALQLIEEQTTKWDREAWMSAKIKAEKGSLNLVLGSYENARKTLQDAVGILEKQTPVNLRDLPSALLNLGVVEESVGAVDEAEKLGQHCLDLYRKHELPTDLTLAESHNLLGSCLALRGEYAQAIECFRDGVACCEKLGAAANLQHSNLLLNIALLHKAQGDPGEALRYCVAARKLYQTYGDPDSLEMASLNAALADLYAAQGKYHEAADLAETILQSCARQKITSGLLVVTARHCQALDHLYRREFGPAEEGWQALLALQEKEQQALFLPRTLNFLGVAAEMQGHVETAERYYRRALALQENNIRAFPATHFISLWRLANLAERQGRLSDALAQLEQGMALIEAVRLRTYGDAQQRTTFFAQFAPAFDQFVDWSVRAGKPEEVLARAARTRSRSLLDQMQLAGVDPRKDLQGPRREPLLRQEALLRERVSSIRARAQLLSLSAGQEETKKLVAEMEEAQRSYAEVWREILNGNPIYRSLAGQEQLNKLSATLREQVLGPRNLLLVYYLGQERSHLLLIGDKSRPAEVFPLTVSSGLLNSLAALPPTKTAEGKRGISLKGRPPQVPATLPKPGITVPLTQERARFLVESYRQQLEDPAFQAGRGIRLVPRDPARPDGPEPDCLGEIFLPAVVRKRIKECAPDELLVVPDGALHKIPLEALPLELGSKPRYLLDELPPITYAPSTSVLVVLAERARIPLAGPLTLLTVSNPAYPQAAGKPAQPAPQTAATLLGLRGQLPLLPFTGEEARSIQKCFEPGRVVALEGEQATEQAVVKALAGQQRIVHFAAHGFAEERYGNLFGALALTPPPLGQETADNDGFLTWNEINRLPLRDCELAVLSACETNIGPQRPLEAGVTLAGAFLTAGARRVVASHWSVDDRSTAELMSTFFTEITAAGRTRDPVNFAQALQKARLKVRNNSRWASPFYWAPFALIGPPTAATHP